MSICVSMSPISAACWSTVRAASHSLIRGGLAIAGASTARGELAERQPVATLTATHASDPAATCGAGEGEKLGVGLVAAVNVAV